MRALAIVSLLVVLSSPVLAAGHSSVAQAERSGEIVVRGQAEASAAPDRVAVRLSVVARSRGAEEAAVDLATRQRSAMEALRDPGLNVDKLTTEGYSVQPRWRRDDNGNREPVGYEARISIVAESDVLERVGAIIDAALDAGVEEVDYVGFSVADGAGLRRRALAGAVAEARASAETMAEAAGGRLGRLIELSTEELGGRPSPMPMAAARVMAAEAAPEIAPGDEVAYATVIGRWEFVPGR